jgi:hypothetical protein
MGSGNGELRSLVSGRLRGKLDVVRLAGIEPTTLGFGGQSLTAFVRVPPGLRSVGKRCKAHPVSL